jgi:hypothetical protein
VASTCTSCTSIGKNLWLSHHGTSGKERLRERLSDKVSPTAAILSARVPPEEHLYRKTTLKGLGHKIRIRFSWHVLIGLGQGRVGQIFMIFLSVPLILY